MTEREVFATTLAVLSATFDRKLTEGAIDGYWAALSDLGEDEFKKAAQRALAECRFMPAPAELRAFARPPRNHETDSAKAWGVVRKAVDKHDYMVSTIDFGPLVNAVIRNLGGWDMLCKATLPELDNPGWLRKRFDEIYGLFARTNVNGLHGDPLSGALPDKWLHPRHVVVPIDGSAPHMRIESPERALISEQIRALAEAHGSSVLDPQPADPAPTTAPTTAPSAAPPERRAALAPMTEDEIIARKAEISRKLAEWAKNNPDAGQS